MAQTSVTKAFAQACSYCHSRKIKCIPSGESSCRTCEDNSIKCRSRRPKKLGRPRGASKPSFPCQKQSLVNYKCLPSRRGRGTSPNAGSFGSSNRTSTPHSSDPSCTGLFFPPSTTQPQQSPKMLNTVKTEHWSNTIPDAMKHPPFAQPFLDTFADVPPAKEISAISEADMSIMNMSFEDLFVDAQLNDASFAGASLPSFASLFTSYLEAHEALTVMRSGLYEFPVHNIKDDRGAMDSLTKISELGVMVVNSDTSTMSSFPGSNDQCCLQLAFLAAVKGCELAEQMSIMILPSVRAPSHASSMDFPAMTPPYCGKAVASPMEDYTWATGTSVQNDHSKPSVEHITALVRLDVQLSQLNYFMSKFIHSTPDHLPLANVLAARWRKRLSYLHTQIRGVVDSMLPAWD